MREDLIFLRNSCNRPFNICGSMMEGMVKAVQRLDPTKVVDDARAALTASELNEHAATIPQVKHVDGLAGPVRFYPTPIVPSNSLALQVKSEENVPTIISHTQQRLDELDELQRTKWQAERYFTDDSQSAEHSNADGEPSRRVDTRSSAVYGENTAVARGESCSQQGAGKVHKRRFAQRQVRHVVF